MRKKIIAGNWKLNKTATEARVLTHSLLLELDRFDRADIVLCPPFTALHVVSEMLTDVPTIRLGAQHLFWEDSGAYTGEVSASMLRDLYCRYVIVGHSERRQYFGETDELVNKRVLAAVRASLKPIVCIGETLTERDQGTWKKVLTQQVVGGLKGLVSEQLEDVIVAYEPVWAIGTGRTATPSQAQEAHEFIRQVLAETFDLATAKKMRIQYGGSVKPVNARELLHQPDIDGALVGGASLDAIDFAAIVKSSCVD